VREYGRVTAKMSNPWVRNAMSGDAENQFWLQVFNKVKIMSHSQKPAAVKTTKIKTSKQATAELLDCADAQYALLCKKKK